MSNRTVTLDSWTFGLIPESARKGRIVALFGTIVETQRFLAGSGRIISYDPKSNIAKSESGTQYILGTPDDKTPDDLEDAIEKYSV